MTTHLRDLHFAHLCDTLASVAPTAPTLCEGWDAHDLAVHIWVIKHDPLSWPGIVLPAREPTTVRRAERFRRRWTYECLVEKLRRESGTIAAMPLDRFEGHRHALGEYYIHTQDVRRANDLPHLTPTKGTEDVLWLRARTAGRQTWGRNRAATQFMSPYHGAFTVGRGVPTRQVSGLPSEVILWIYGRTEIADVTVTTLP